MKILKSKKVIVYVLIGIVVLQVGVVGYSMVGKELFSLDTGSETQTASSTPSSEVSLQTPQTVDSSIIQENNAATDTEISEEIQDLIRQSDPDNFDKNLTNYKDLLTRLDVHVSLKQEIEQLIKNGYPIKEILIAYEFLYISYGTKAELENMVAEKKIGKTWVNIFADYNLKNPEFEPSKFKTEDLDNLMKNQGVSKDDIMIADRVSKKVLNEFDEVIQLKITNKNWKIVKAYFGILNSQQQLLYISAKPAEIKKYSTSGISQDKIILALVIAKELNTENDTIVEMVKNGMSNEEIYANCLESRY